MPSSSSSSEKKEKKKKKNTNAYLTFLSKAWNCIGPALL